MRWTDLDGPVERSNHAGIACRGTALEEQKKACFSWHQQWHARHVFTFFALFRSQSKIRITGKAPACTCHARDLARPLHHHKLGLSEAGQVQVWRYAKMHQSSTPCSRGYLNEDSLCPGPSCSSDLLKLPKGRKNIPAFRIT